MLKFIKKYLLLLILLLVSFISSYSQGYKVTGKVLDRTDQSPLVGANVIITNAQDSTDRHITITNSDGVFIVSGLSKRLYKLTASYMGYDKLNQSLAVSFKNQTIDNVFLNPTIQQLKQVTIIGTPPPAILKGDTSEFNASSFKVTADANIEDLVKKMPGVTIENGTVKAQGEEVKKVYVDGKPFFGDDPSVALKNLPAEIVDKVQVFDQQSEQSQLTGFNDGQTTKTMNIVTRTDKRNGQFGKLNAAYGSDDRYSVGGNINKFKGNQRISLIGLSNNINQQNFGTQDFLGAMGGSSTFGSRGDRGSSGRSGSSGNSAGSSGITTVNSIGLNYSNIFKDKLTLTGSYFYNNTKNENYSIVNTQNILSTDSSKFENSSSNSSTKNFNNRVNFRVEWKIDSMNTLIILPSINFQTNKSYSLSHEDQSLGISDLIARQNESNSVYNTNSSGYNISNRITYRHKFLKESRTLSFDLYTTFNERTPYTTSNSDLTIYSRLDTSSTLIDRTISTMNSGYTINSNIAYTEPINKISILQFNVANSYSRTYANKITSDYDLDNYQYQQIDTLSNKYLNYFITNKLGLSYRLKTDRLSASAGFEFQNSNLSGDQTYPRISNTDKSFNNVLPNVQARYKMTQQTSAVFNYRTSTTPPSISQLQDVSEYSSNLTKITKGNPNLEPQYQHDISTRFIHIDRQKGNNFFFLFGGTILQNSIGNSTTYLDTIQIVMPVNKGTAYALRSMLNYGFVIKPIKCNLNLSGGYNYNRTPGFVNGKINTSTTNAFSGSVVISSNISEYIDFTISTSGSYTLVENTVTSSNNNNYYSQNSGFRLNWIIWKGFTLQNDISNKLYRGLSADYNTNVTVVNLGIGKKVFKNQSGEFRITAYDLFNKSTSISRTISANTITDTQSKILSRYVLASFTYTFRKFKSGSAPQERERRRRDFDGGPPMGGPGGAPMGPPPGY
jgi:hypothetical protein